MAGRPELPSEATFGIWPISAHGAIAITSPKQHDWSSTITPRKREMMAGQTIEREPITKTKMITDLASWKD
jgi:hypothetical protein